MISASAADSHRFGRVKRNGYDPDEVDAVVARLVDAIRKYETRTDELAQRLSEADASADAIRRTFVAAENTRDELLDEARSEADRISSEAGGKADKTLSEARTRAAGIVADAQAEADRISEAATTSAEQTAELASKVDAEVAAHRDRILTKAYDEAERVVVGAELSASERVTMATIESEDALEIAERSAERSRRSGSASLRAALIASAWVRREASLTASAIVADAESAAAATKGEAELDAEEAHARAEELRRAIFGLDDAARHLAALTTEGLSVVDLSEIEATEVPEPVIADANPVPQSDKWATRSAARETETEVGGAAPLLTVAEATEELEIEATEGLTSDEPSTYYQRSTGTPLSERVKIARQSG